MTAYGYLLICIVCVVSLIGMYSAYNLGKRHVKENIQKYKPNETKIRDLEYEIKGLRNTCDDLRSNLEFYKQIPDGQTAFDIEIMAIIGVERIALDGDYRYRQYGTRFYFEDKSFLQIATTLNDHKAYVDRVLALQLKNKGN